MKPTLSNIHLTLQKVRKEKNISQLEMANFLNIEQASVSMYENGKRGIPLDVLEKWADVLEIELAVNPKGFEPSEPESDVDRDWLLFEELKKQRDNLAEKLRERFAEALQSYTFDVGDGRRIAEEKDMGLYFGPYSHNVSLICELTNENGEKTAVFFNEMGIYTFYDEAESRYVTPDELPHLHRWGAELIEDRFMSIIREDEGSYYVSAGAEQFSLALLFWISLWHEGYKKVFDELNNHDENYMVLLEAHTSLSKSIKAISERNRLTNGEKNPRFVAFDPVDEAVILYPSAPPKPLDEEHETKRGLTSVFDDEGGSSVASGSGSEPPQRKRSFGGSQ